jgi:hypothetical protein
MAYQQLSFAPDRRSIQTTFYHFNERPSGDVDRRGFSQQDSLTYALDKIYQSKFADISQQFRNTLVGILVPDVPLAHQNLVMLAAANFIVFDMRQRRIPFNIDPATYNGGPINSMDQSNFEAYFRRVESAIMPELTGKSPEEIALIRAKFKATLLRYIIYVMNNTNNIANTAPSQTDVPVAPLTQPT